MFLTSDVYCIYLKNFKCPFDFGLLYVNNFFDVSSCFDILPMVLFLPAFISIWLWNRQLYWPSYTLMLWLRFCEFVSLAIIDFEGPLAFRLILV